MSIKIREPKVEKIVKLEGIRKTIYQRLKFSKNEYPHAYLASEIDVSRVVLKRETTEYRPSYNAIFLKAVAESIKLHPVINSSLENDEIKIYSDINVSLAVDTPSGLMVPVIDSVDKRSLKEVDEIIKNLAEKARQNKLTLYDITGGTITVSNLGSFNIDLFLPIINPPQSSIIGIGKINEKKKAFLSLSFNHAVYDGAEGARFLNDLKKLIESNFINNL